MNIEFDFNKRKRNPTLILCNPNGQELYAMGVAKDVEYSKDYNAVSELSFKIPKYKDESIIPYYEKIQGNRLVKIDGVGVYIITDVNRSQKGTIEEYKTVDCVGLEFELSSRNLDILDGTYCLYDATGTNTEKSIIHIVLSYLPNWTISSVDSDLWDVWRTFSIQDVNIYNFLMGEISQTYDCVFLFDTFNRQIKVVKTNNLKKQTDVYLSGRNLIKELDMDESSDSLVTALTVYGDGDLSIRTVNPLGTATIYNFDYFMTTDWMSQELINAITSWKTKGNQSDAQFTLLLSQLKTKQNELVVLESQLADLETTKKSLEQGQSLAITNGDNTACSLYASQIRSKDIEINNKKTEIANKKADIDTTQATLRQIPTSLSLDNPSNFNADLRKELDTYIKQASKQNTDYAVTEEMTNDEAIQVATDLFTWGKEQLAKLSQPIWTFELSTVNFLNLIEYKDISNQLDLGSEVIIEVDKTRDLYAYAMLIGYTIKLDKPDDIELRFSSALNFKRTSMTYDEAFQKAASISKSYDFESPSWKKGNEAYNKMNEYINQGFVDLTKDILSADNQEFTLSNTGIRGREYLPETDTYSPEELRMTKNVLAFSDDGFNTTKTAIGKIKLPDGSAGFGVVGEAIIGKMFLGKTLLLETEDKSLVWNGDGLTIKNANIIMTSDEGVDETLESALKNIENSTSKNLSDAVVTINGNITDIQEAIKDGIIEIFYQTTQPSGKLGDLWYDTNIVDGVKSDKCYRHNGTGWDLVKDSSVSDAIRAAQSAQTTADGKIRTFYQVTQPSMTPNKDIGDLWVDTDDGNKLYRWDGYVWMPIQDKSIMKDNILYNSYPNINDTRCWGFGNGISIAYNKDWYGSLFGLSYPTSGEQYLTSKRYLCQPNTTYTLSFDFSGSGYTENGAAMFYILESSTSTNINEIGGTWDAIVGNSWIVGGSGDNIWERKTYTFTTSGSAKSFHIRFDAKSNELVYSPNKGGYYWLRRIKLEEGKTATTYCKSSGEDSYFAAQQAQDSANNAQNTANSAIGIINGTINANGTINTDKLQGTILAGNNNIQLGTGVNRVLLNNSGILMSNNSGSSWTTAISPLGIVAEAIQSGGTISGCSVKAGNFTYSTYGELTKEGYVRGYYFGKKTFELAHRSEGQLSLGSDIGNYSSPYMYFNPISGLNGLTYCGISASGTSGLLLKGAKVVIDGNFSATGTKQAVVKTDHYGRRSLYCEEADRSYFNTHGKGMTHLTTDNKYQFIIRLDDIFLETIEINSVFPYIIHLTQYSNDSIWVKEVYDKYIIIQSEKEAKFDYTIRGARRWYSNCYLEEN